VNPEHLLGNISRTPLVELLESPAQRAFGQAKLETLPDYCRACDVRAMCNGGCPKNRFSRTPEGQTGLNYLCAGYKLFFKHCRPFITEVAAQWRRQQLEEQVTLSLNTSGSSLKGGAFGDGTEPGRNEPCPCGSGLKYKKCCLGK
jgi:uncharacterized protein